MKDFDIRQKRELEDPIRKRIWDLYEKDGRRPQTAQGVQKAIAAPGEDLPVSSVNYHLRRLQRAGLLPEPTE